MSKQKKSKWKSLKFLKEQAQGDLETLTTAELYEFIFGFQRYELIDMVLEDIRTVDDAEEFLGMR